MLSRKPTQQPQRPGTECLYGLGRFRIDGCDRGGEVDRADRFGTSAELCDQELADSCRPNGVRVQLRVVQDNAGRPYSVRATR